MAGDGRSTINGSEYRPSGELISAMLTLVWAIAGICEEGISEEGPSGGGVAVGRGAGGGKW
jgi:hypothetical protein